MSTLTQRTLLPWAALVLTVGVLAGFVFGEARAPAAVAEPSPAAGVADPAAPPTVAVDGAAVALPAPAGSASPLACTGHSPPPGSYHEVLGVREAGAEALANVTGVESFTKFLDELNRPEHEQELQHRLAAASAKGPAVLMLQLSEGKVQRRLAEDTLTRWPSTVVVVVTRSREQVADAVSHGYPEAALVVEPQPDATETSRVSWASAVHQIVTGAVPCSGG